MRTLDPAVLSALQSGRVSARDFLWIVARDRTTGAAVPDGMWSDYHAVNADVIDPDTGNVVTRAWTGVGTLVQIADVPLVSNITVQRVTITLSQVSDHVATLVRLYDCKQAVVQLFRGIFDPQTNSLIGAAVPRFVGFVDDIEIVTPTENTDGSVTMNCVSHTQEMTRSNPDTRSSVSQVLRSGTDNFFQDVATIGQVEFFWGRNGGTIDDPLKSALPQVMPGFFGGG